jgi:archaellum component FlaC
MHFSLEKRQLAEHPTLEQQSKNGWIGHSKWGLFIESSLNMFVGHSILRRLSVMFAVTFGIGMMCSTATVHGEGIELNVTAQKAWNMVLNKADAQTKRNLQQSYETAGQWKSQKEMWEQKIKQLHTTNATELMKLRKEISGIDAAKLAALHESLEHTRTRYEPLFQLYSSLNKQLSAAKGLQSKEFSSAIRTQAETLKPLVQLAREDIRTKKMNLAEARKRKNNEVKRLRTMLNGTIAVKKQIKSAKKQVSLSRERYKNSLRNFKQILKKGEPSRALSALNSLVSSAERWSAATRNIHTLEQKVSAIYVKVSQEIRNRPN